MHNPEPTSIWSDPDNGNVLERVRNIDMEDLLLGRGSRILVYRDLWPSTRYRIQLTEDFSHNVPASTLNKTYASVKEAQRAADLLFPISEEA